MNDTGFIDVIDYSIDDRYCIAPAHSIKSGDKFTIDGSGIYKANKVITVRLGSDLQSFIEDIIGDLFDLRKVTGHVYTVPVEWEEENDF